MYESHIFIFYIRLLQMGKCGGMAHHLFFVTENKLKWGFSYNWLRVFWNIIVTEIHWKRYGFYWTFWLFEITCLFQQFYLHWIWKWVNQRLMKVVENIELVWNSYEVLEWRHKMMAFVFFGWFISFGARSKSDMIAKCTSVSLFKPVDVDWESYSCGYED